ncbi:class I SAM-dependent methyltransferase [Pontibacter qinzhouensis]|uniref:Class I SAM-dependent methyltransferase n=1 Tax=Pontibacter qinzhouensis TaxID=2603253 RepID=A0A5C8JJT1_9BACT|nr:class I SAM-dependent methyltransferase [Pontibacter qinzhouensis]TXK36847.1 class I SAM-dependent methyltransferase [Pontibacter qinzhouensis]
MAEFWESSFQDKSTMWGFDPADSALATAQFFKQEGLSTILIPGFGYGRNAKVFADTGCFVTGIEISETAIALAQDHFGNGLNIYHGSVTAMPFDQELYDGIFCYALIHLLNEKERLKLIEDCYNQLKPGGYMVFVAISKNDAAYGAGEKLSKDSFKTRHGVELFFYNADAVKAEFGAYGLIESIEINEPSKPTGNKPSQKFWQITCRK